MTITLVTPPKIHHVINLILYSGISLVRMCHHSLYLYCIIKGFNATIVEVNLICPSRLYRLYRSEFSGGASVCVLLRARTPQTTSARVLRPFQTAGFGRVSTPHSLVFIYYYYQGQKFPELFHRVKDFLTKGTILFGSEASLPACRSAISWNWSLLYCVRYFRLSCSCCLSFCVPGENHIKDSSDAEEMKLK